MYIVLYDCIDPFNENSIRGIMEIKVDIINRQRIHSADKAIATEGYGPLLYLLAIDHTGINGLTSDLTGKTSPAASQVWKEFYEGKGSSSVNCIPFNHPTRDEPWFNVLLTGKFTIQGLDAALSRQSMVDHDLDKFVGVFKEFLLKKIQPFC